jgi:two-component system sensor histidine kinase KdpD
LTNLLLNAAFHTPAGTLIQVSARAERDELVLAVADSGPGIPPESLTKIFDKFYRAPGALTGGTGLGLSIVKGFVEAQGGRVNADNRPGGGAVFTLYLPITEQPVFPGEAA